MTRIWRKIAVCLLALLLIAVVAYIQIAPLIDLPPTIIAKIAALGFALLTVGYLGLWQLRPEPWNGVLHLPFLGQPPPDLAALICVRLC